MNDFCSQKGFKRGFSNARTPQQNGVAKKRNRTLIEEARTMLADAKLPVTFWAEAVNTACYVQNRVLVNKSQNKTPYELFNGRTPAIGFLKPFGCHVMILNTLDNLGKFKAKGDEGYFIGYFMSSKAFRVFNNRTKRVEENLHVEFLENKAIEKGAGPSLFIDSLTNSMNYVPVVSAGTNSTNLLGTKDAASQEVKKDVSSLRYIALPNWVHDVLLESSSMETPIPTVSSPVPTAYFTDSQEPSSDIRLILKGVANQVETPSLDNILTLTNQFEDIHGVTTNSVDSDGVEADVSNMETTITASLTPTLRIHKDHPKCQITGHVDTSIQTRHKSKQHVWSLVDFPKGVRPIGTKWVLKNKKDERWIVIRNKARLVAQGHTLEEGIDYDEPRWDYDPEKLLCCFGFIASLRTRYYLNSKACRVFNSRRFRENTPNVVGSGPDWLFDIDALTRIMIYEPIVAGTQSNGFAGTKASDYEGQARKEIEPVKDYILLPLWTADLQFSQTPKSSHDDRFKPSSDDGKKVDEDQSKGDECYDQEKEDNVNSSNNVNTVSLTINAAGTNKDNELPFDPNMPGRSIRLFLPYASFKDFVVYQMDVKSAFLYGKIEKEVYLCQLPGFEDPDFHGRVYKVDKALYGLHQASRAWFTLVKNASKPMETQKSLLKDEDGEEVDVHMYRSMIGSLMYLTSSRPDIIFAVCACAIYQVNPKFWSTAMAKTINRESQIHAWVDGKEIIINESSVRRDLRLTDKEGVDCFPNSTIFENLKLMGKPKRKNTQVPQPSGSTKHVVDEAVYKELDDRLVPRYHGDTIPPTRFENVSKLSNDSLLVRGKTLQSDRDRMKLNELVKLCTNLQLRVLDLEKTKITQALEITSLKKRVKKLEKKQRSRTHKLKRLYKVGLTARVDSSKDAQTLGEDASKQERKIDDIDADEDITLVNDQDDAKMFDVNDL
nr:hypothetical protein [Tanacetum cinerariifolium]